MIDGQEIQRRAFEDFEKWQDSKRDEVDDFDSINVWDQAVMYANDDDWHNQGRDNK